MADKRLIKLLQTRGNEMGGQMLDTYNQQIQEGVSCTIRTNINTANHLFVVMEEPQVINTLKGQSDNGWHFEQQVYDAEGIARAVKAGEESGNIPKVIVYDDYNQNIPKNQSVIGTITTNIGSSTPRNGIKLIEVFEPISVAMRGRNPDNPSERGKSNGNYKQRLEMNESGVANTNTSVQKDSMVAEPMCSVHPNSQKFEYDPRTSIKPIRPALRATDYKAPHCAYMPDEQRYRIRKLTPRECFRLMGVDDKDIDTIQTAGISNSQQYKLAGNSIVVDVLYHIFRKAFCETHNENQQQTLF